MIIQLKRATYDRAVEKNPILATSEPLFIKDKNLLYIGDGSSKFTDLVPVNLSSINVRTDMNATTPYVETDGTSCTIVFPKSSGQSYQGGGISTNKVIELIKEAFTNVDLSNYTLLTTTSAISGNLQSQINQIVQEGTSIASSGGSILVSQNGVSFNLEVATAPIQNHNELNGLEGIGGDGGYWHLSENQYSNISGGVDLSGYTLLTTTQSISAGLDSRITTINTNYATKATPISGTYNTVVVNSQGIVTSGGNVAFTVDLTPYTLLTTTQSISGNLQTQITQTNLNVVHLTGNETISGNKTFVNTVSCIRGNNNLHNESFGANTMVSIVDAQDNTAVGYGSSQLITTGKSNVSIGFNSLNKNKVGIDNVAIGSHALINYLGDDNVAIGKSALFTTTTGSANTAVGNGTLSTNTGYYNTAMGRESLGSNGSGSQNTGLGFQALGGNSTASNNTGVGYRSLYGISTGGNNTAIGFEAGSNPSVGAATNCIFIGYNAKPTVDSITNSICIGASTSISGSNQVILGNSSITSTKLRGIVTVNGDNASVFVELTSQPTPTTTRVKGNFGYYGGYFYKWIADSVVVRHAAETIW